MKRARKPAARFGRVELMTDEQYAYDCFAVADMAAVRMSMPCRSEPELRFDRFEASSAEREGIRALCRHLGIKPERTS